MVCKSEFLPIKTDMSKTYDRVEWGVLKALFTRMGFNRRWIEWIMWCVTSVSYTVLFNGRAHGHITYYSREGFASRRSFIPFSFHIMRISTHTCYETIRIGRKNNGHSFNTCLSLGSTTAIYL